MHLRVLLALAAGAALIAAHLVPPPPARACAIVSRSGGPKIAGEEALIVWDEAAGIEHFVRTASFAGATESLGFLVPTPARPTLGEADDRVFDRLARIYLRPPPQGIRSRGAVRGLTAGPAGAPPVTVVERRTVAGLDAAVLAASDARALNAWLGQNGFPSRPALEAWLAPYVARGFFVTAFRYDPGAQQGTFASRAVRLSFPVDAPFYPYAEPSDAPRTDGRRFRLHVVAPFRVDARLGGRRSWGARVGFAGRVDDFASVLAGAIPSGAARDAAWLTTFEEVSSRRGRDDLRFVRARRQRAVASTIDARIGAPGPEPRRGGPPASPDLGY